MRKSPIKIKLQYFPSNLGEDKGTYKVVRIEGAPNVYHPKSNAQRLRLGDALNEYEAEKLSTLYPVVTVL